MYSKVLINMYKKTSKLLATVTMASFLFFTFASVVRGDNPTTDPKTTICHATGSESNPYNKITVSTNAVSDSGHLDHEDDIIFDGDIECPDNSSSPTPTSVEKTETMSNAIAITSIPTPTNTLAYTPTPTSTPTSIATIISEPQSDPGCDGDCSEEKDPQYTQTPTPTTVANFGSLILTKFGCSDYSQVPANQNADNIDETGGFYAQLGGQSPLTGVALTTANQNPNNCTPLSDWVFELYASEQDLLNKSNLVKSVTTNALGVATVIFDQSLFDKFSQDKIWVREVLKADSNFMALKCDLDHVNGDNSEEVNRSRLQNGHNRYCAAYNHYVVPTTTPTPTFTPTSTPTVKVCTNKVNYKIYRDDNANGTQDNGEKNLSNVEVKVKNQKNNDFWTSNSDFNGEGSFDLFVGQFNFDVRNDDPDFPGGYVATQGNDPIDFTLTDCENRSIVIGFGPAKSSSVLGDSDAAVLGESTIRAPRVLGLANTGYNHIYASVFGSVVICAVYFVLSKKISK